MSDDWENITIQMPPTDAERYEELASSKSGTGRLILRTWMDVVEEHNLQEESKQVQLAVLSAYRNAIEKNISTLKSQRDKLQNAIDDLKDDDNEDEEVLFEVELKLQRRNL
jgi:uncharacterized protein YlxW (UPF0749 family)